MKLLSRGRPWAFVFELFPEARFVHVTRSPTTAVPSMMEFVGRDYGVWQRVETAESEFVTAHREALDVRDLGKPYLCVRQGHRQGSTACVGGGVRVRRLCGGADRGAPSGGQCCTLDARPGSAGSAAALLGSALAEVVAVSQDLGYLPRAPERDGVKAVVNAALASQLEDAERSRAVLARTCDELRAQLDRLHGTIGGILEPLRSLRVRGDRLTLDEVRRVLEPVAETVDAYLGLVRERDRRERVPAADGDPPRLEFRTTLPCQRRTGTGEVQLERVELLDAVRAAVRAVGLGDRVAVEATLRAFVPVDNVSVSFAVRDAAGVSLLGTTTFDERVPLPALEPGTVLTVRFAFEHRLRPGVYSLAVAVTRVTRRDYADARLFDQADGCVTFHALASPERPVHYLVHEPVAIEWSRA